jgi:hypothetical protein
MNDVVKANLIAGLFNVMALVWWFYLDADLWMQVLCSICAFGAFVMAILCWDGKR